MTKEPDKATPSQEAQESLIRILLFDVMAAQQRVTADQSQSNMRDLIRCAFAAVEGMLWICSEHVADVAKQMDEITATEAMALSQVAYHVTPQGKVDDQPRYLPPTTAIRLAVRIAQRINPQLEGRYDTAGWSRMREAIDIRNRITHPKRPEDLLINEDEAAACLAAMHWMLELAERTMTAVNNMFAKHTADLWDVFRRLENGDPKTWSLYRSLLTSRDG